MQRFQRALGAAFPWNGIWFKMHFSMANLAVGSRSSRTFSWRGYAIGGVWLYGRHCGERVVAAGMANGRTRRRMRTPAGCREVP